MRSYPCKVVGINYEGRLPYILAEVREGDSLELKAEPDNQYDDKAVAVFHHSRKIGYIPSNKSWVSKSLVEGDEHEVVADGLVMNDNGEPGAIAITITIVRDGNPVEQLLEESQKVEMPPQTIQQTGSGMGFMRFMVLSVFVVGASALLLNGRPTNTFTTASTSPAAAKQYATIDKSAAMQAKREKLISNMLNMHIFSKVDMDGIAARVTIDREFNRVDFEMKQTFIGIVYAQKFDGTGIADFVRVLDNMTGKEIGMYSAAQGGLQMY